MARRATAHHSGDVENDVIKAALDLVSELRLCEVLRRVVQTATILVDAGDGLLAVLGAGGEVVEFVGSEGGPPDSELARAVADSAPLGVLWTHAALTPVPCPPDRAGGAAKTSALGVPIRTRRGFQANLYVANKSGGQGFSDDDEALLRSLATIAGAAIDNAQLCEEGRQRELWVALQGQIATSLLAGVDTDEVLDLIARGARELTNAAASTVLLYDGSSTLTLRAADGLGVRDRVGARYTLDQTISGGIIKSGKPVVFADASAAGPTSEPLLSDGAIGPAIIVPLVSNGRAIGALAVGRVPTSQPMTHTDFWLLDSFASQVSVAMEYGRARSELERLAVIDDHERIARDLHDNIIQQLFATGMSLQATALRMSDDGAADRVRQAVTALDETIREIRSAVFAIRSQPGQTSGLRANLQDLASRQFESSGITVALHFDGPVDNAIDHEAAQHIVATLREALSNVRRHALATHAEVFLHVGSEIVLRVVDNGIGIGADRSPRGGLINLTARAELLGGEMRLSTPASGGTALEWIVPLAASARPASPKEPVVRRPEGAGKPSAGVPARHEPSRNAPKARGVTPRR